MWLTDCWQISDGLWLIKLQCQLLNSRYFKQLISAPHCQPSTETLTAIFLLGYQFYTLSLFWLFHLQIYGGCQGVDILFGAAVHHWRAVHHDGQAAAHQRPGHARRAAEHPEPQPGARPTPCGTHGGGLCGRWVWHDARLGRGHRKSLYVRPTNCPSSILYLLLSISCVRAVVPFLSHRRGGLRWFLACGAHRGILYKVSDCNCCCNCNGNCHKLLRFLAIFPFGFSFGLGLGDESCLLSRAILEIPLPVPSYCTLTHKADEGVWDVRRVVEIGESQWQPSICEVFRL